jgi:hypothetical protein
MQTKYSLGFAPTVLPYELDTLAYFNVAGFNGHALTDLMRA